MKRISLLILWAVTIAGYIVWNLYHPAESSFVGRDGAIHITGSGGHLPLSVLLVALAALYGFHWINMVNEWDRRPVLRFGKYMFTVGPGLCFVEPLFYSTLEDVPVQDVAVGIETEGIQTKDNVGVDLIGLITYKVDPAKVRDAVVNVDDYHDAILQRAHSTLTDIVGQTDLDHLLAGRDTFCDQIKKVLADRVKEWGPQIKAFELKGFKIADPDIEKAIAMKARAKKEGEAEVTRAEMQKQVAEALNEAAKSFDGQGSWLKELEVLIELCRSANNNTILIPNSLMGSLTQMIQKKTT